MTQKKNVPEAQMLQKITVRLPQPLYHRLRLKAVEQGTTVQALMAEGVKLILENQRRSKTSQRR